MLDAAHSLVLRLLDNMWMMVLMLLLSRHLLIVALELMLCNAARRVKVLLEVRWVVDLVGWLSKLVVGILVVRVWILSVKILMFAVEIANNLVDDGGGLCKELILKLGLLIGDLVAWVTGVVDIASVIKLLNVRVFVRVAVWRSMRFDVNIRVRAHFRMRALIWLHYRVNWVIFRVVHMGIVMSRGLWHFLGMIEIGVRWLRVKINVMLRFFLVDWIGMVDEWFN